MIPASLSQKRIEWTVTFATGLLVILTLSTYLLDQHKSNWVCGPTLLIFETIAIGLQLLLNVLTWKSSNKRIKVAMLYASLGLVALIIVGFVNFVLNCS